MRQHLTWRRCPYPWVKSMWGFDRNTLVAVVRYDGGWGLLATRQTGPCPPHGDESVDGFPALFGDMNAAEKAYFGDDR